MVDGVDPDSSFHINPNAKIPPPKPVKIDPASGSQPDIPVGKMHHVLGMNMTGAQYQKFLSQLVNSLITQVKKDEAKMKKAMQQMKKSFERGG